ncbi:MAG: PulJ/GspJ family protein [Planctomycetota bacterium]|jgi:type II secretory pathway pseudopilin PulG
MAKRRSDEATKRRRGGFTLAELMVAVAILIVVIVATSKLFGTASKVTGLGQAGADVLQEAAAVERQIRADFQRLAPEGFFAVRCVAVRNNANAPGPLLNPALPFDAFIRADQLVFFANGVQSIQTFRQGAGANRKAQATVSRVYYGHAFQAPEGPDVKVADPDAVWAIDPAIDLNDLLVPWYVGTRDFVRTRFQRNAGDPPGDYVIQGVFGSFNVTQPPARQWLLARQAVVLADDGGSPVVYLDPASPVEGGHRSAYTIADAVVRHGRVDAAASQLNDIRRLLTVATRGGIDELRPWLRPAYVDDAGFGDQRSVIGGLVFYPRGERVAPSMHRVDQALTASVLAGACSSFAVDWTYENGVGAVDLDKDGVPEWNGAIITTAAEQPWFGMPDLDNPVDPDPERGTAPFVNWTTPGDTILPDNIDFLPYETSPGSGVYVYEAFFGYNQDTPLDPTTGAPWLPSVPIAYTPWPSALRITMTFHDTGTRLESGREVEFVIDLPRRVE